MRDDGPEYTKHNTNLPIELQVKELDSVVLSNEAEARAKDADAEHTKALATLSQIEVEREKNKDLFDNSQDYRAGQICFCAVINNESGLALTGTLRRIARMYPQRGITIELHSPGGEIPAGFAIFDEVRRISEEGCPITIRVRGQVCSMASVLLQAADIREIGARAHLMLHEASFEVKGSTSEVADAVEEGKMMEAAMYKVLSTRSGKSVAWWKKRLSTRKDIWWTAEDAIKDGLADVIR